MLTITNKNNSEDKEYKKKKTIFLSARIHPGETVGSFKIKGVIDYLT